MRRTDTPGDEAPRPSLVPATTPTKPAPAAGAGAPGSLRLVRFLTAGLDPAEAQQAYLDRLDGILDTQFLVPLEAAFDAYSMGAFTVLCATATPRRSARSSARIAQDRYDSINVQYIVAGRATGEANGETLTSTPGSILLLDYAQPFAVVDQETRIVVNVAVPRAMFPHNRRDPGDWHGAVLDGAAAAPLVGFLHLLHDTLEKMPRAAGSALAAAFAQLLIVALEDYEREDTVVANRDARIVERAERLVDDRIGSADLDPTWLANRLGLSRSELYAAMERFGGVARFIMQHRLTGARAALANPADTRRIGAIAYSFGFSSEAHFSRAFRAAFGVTSSNIRRHAGAKE